MRQLKLILAALFLITPFAANADEIVLDGGFEDGSPNSFWTEASTNFGTPLCTVATCGTGTGTGANSGSWWAWFGGISAVEMGLVSQQMMFLNGTAELSFWFENIVSGASSGDFISVFIDDISVWTYNGGDYLDGILGYTQIFVNLDSFADGGMHTLSFYSEVSGDGVTNFFVDDVSINTTAVPEPGTLALLGIGLLGMGMARRRRKV